MTRVRILFNTFFVATLLAVSPGFVLAKSSFSKLAFSLDNIPPASSERGASLPLDNFDQGDEEDVLPDEELGDEVELSCFDYYKFQSVQVTAAPQKQEFTPGEYVFFKGEVTNENKYPVVDGYVFVRVGPANPRYDKEGHHIADEFFGAERVSIDSGATKPIEFEWKIPKGSSGGEYVANYFFSVDKRFNLGGLPFSNEVIIGSTRFSVEGGESGSLVFDRNGTTVNGKKYFHIGNWPVIEPGAPVKISQVLKNTDKSAKEIKVTYELYYWDSLRVEDKVASRDETLRLGPGASKTLQYDISKMDTSVYYLKIKASSEDDQTIINVRVASNIPRPRLNYPAITKFPVSRGEQFTVFSCFHNTSYVDAEGKVNVFLSDKKGNKVSEASYSGAISPDMLVAAGEVTAPKTYDYLELRSEIRDSKGVLVDSYETVYDCKELGGSACERISRIRLIRNIFVGLLILLIIVAALFWKKSRSKKLYNNLDS